MERDRMRRCLLRACVVVGFGSLAGCASAWGPRTVEISQAQLLQALAAELPVSGDPVDTWGLVTGAPRLKMLPQTNRVATEIELRLGESLLGQAFPVVVASSFGLRVDTQDNTVRLADLKIDGLQWGGAPVALHGMGTRVATRQIERLLSDRVVYTFTAKDLGEAARWGYRPGPITVKPDGLSLELLPQSP